MTDTPRADEPTLSRYAALSIATSIVVLAAKLLAWWLTHAVGLLADALESIVNVVAAGVTFWALRVAARPADDDHEHGHGKAEYFASGFEGALICVAALAIFVSAVPKLWAPEPMTLGPAGLGVSAAASLANLVVARILLAAGKKHRSAALEADGKHLMTDVVTSGGVLIGLVLVAITKLERLDPVIAILVGLHIVREGTSIVHRAGMGLLDTSMPKEDRQKLVDVLDGFASDGAKWHALKTREAGTRAFASVHLLVPGDWPLSRAHDLAERLENALRVAHPRLDVITHLEPLEDPRSYLDATRASRAGE